MSKTKKSSSGSKGSSTTKKSTTSTAEINQVKQQLNTVKSSLQLESSSLAPMEGTLNTLKELKTRLETAIDTLRNQKDGIEDKYTLDRRKIAYSSEFKCINGRHDSVPGGLFTVNWSDELLLEPPDAGCREAFHTA